MRFLRMLFSKKAEEVKLVKPKIKDFGEGVYFFSMSYEEPHLGQMNLRYEVFGEALSEFKAKNPHLIVTAIAPQKTSSLLLDGFWVNCEKK